MSSTSTHTVQGMTCTSCADKVSAAVAEVVGVEGTAVDVATGTLTVTGAPDDHEVRAAITAAGYQVV